MKPVRSTRFLFALLGASVCAGEPQSARSASADAPGLAADWAFQPLHRSAIPESAAAQHQSLNPIDLFVRSNLDERGLAPSPEADKRTLLRRVYFDLIGLPPTPEDMRAFLADPSPGAYEQAVDRLLASPRY